jgi:hypothetical protein
VTVNFLLFALGTAMKKSESTDYSVSKRNAVSSCSTEQLLSHVHLLLAGFGYFTVRVEPDSEVDF